MHRPLLFAAFLLAIPTAPLPDEGYDLLVLDIPHRLVFPDNLDFTVRGRPGVAYSVLGDIGNNTTPFGNVLIHLNLSPSLFLAGIGTLSATGSNTHSLSIPNVPAFDNIPLYFQAFAIDPGVLRGIAASDGKVVTFHKDDGQPLISLLTVNDIPRDQNGAEPGEGNITVPTAGFAVDIHFDDRGVSPIDPASLVITASRALAGGAVAANTNLASFFTVTGNKASGIVGSTWSFPTEGNTTLTATIANQNGVVSATETFTLRSAPLTITSRPFASQQLWFIDFDSHDLDRNSVPDFREDLVLFGLGNDPLATTGPSENVAQWTRAETIARLGAGYGVGGPDPVDVAFFQQPPPRTHARICVGGRNPIRSGLPPGATETTGAAFLNPRNQRKNIVDCFGQVGVHPRSIFFLFQNVPAFQAVFGPLQANPVGNDPEDPTVTAPGFDPSQGTPAQQARYQEIEAGVTALANAVSFVLVQETSHSMGLVPGGNLTGGLLGAQIWGHSTFGHFDDGQGNFLSGNNSTPAPAQLPNQSLIWDHWQSGRAHFTPLNWAYLRERIIHK